ncbi:hypothetical protein HGB24_03185 [Candidatus Saccharibacteria bacterium]|nr:hypothetical protein [Candidatus Saccharibacteria bacterium]
MTSLVEMSPSYSIHYYEIFADIVRLADDNSLMKIEDEADFTTQNLIDMVKEVYSKWSVDIRIEDYKENDQAGNKDRFYFIANKVIFTAKSPQIFDRSQKF